MMLTLLVANSQNTISQIISFSASIMEVLFVSFSAFFVDWYVVCDTLWEFISFQPYSGGKMQMQY
jgi:hypothetical protein